jgi:predicted histidine transporter YuiF (NhaC family)
MFASLFKRAEESVDSAIGDLGNRILITLPFLVALGFGAASLTLYLDRLYGAELGTLLVAVAFCLLGLIIAIVVRVRKNISESNSNAKDDASPTEDSATTSRPQSMFDDETVMAVMSSAAPIVIPAMIRTGLKNWPVILAAAAGLYVVSRSDHQSAGTPDASPPSPPSS